MVTIIVLARVTLCTSPQHITTPKAPYGSTTITLAHICTNSGILTNPLKQRHRYDIPSYRLRSTSVLLLLLLAGDIESNPGPRAENLFPCGMCKPGPNNYANVYPCGYCERPVTWSNEGVCCDGCSLWHHRSCMEMYSDDDNLLNRSNVQWHYCKCDNINVSSFTYHSYYIDITNNFYYPLSDNEISLDSSLVVYPPTQQDSCFHPLKASTPKVRNTTESNNFSNSLLSEISITSEVPPNINHRYTLLTKAPHNSTYASPGTPSPPRNPSKSDSNSCPRTSLQETSITSEAPSNNANHVNTTPPIPPPQAPSTFTHANANTSTTQKMTKTNLRILSVNCRGLRGKTSEFASLLDYTKPDIVCGLYYFTMKNELAH